MEASSPTMDVEESLRISSLWAIKKRTWP